MRKMTSCVKMTRSIGSKCSDFDINLASIEQCLLIYEKQTKQYVCERSIDKVGCFATNLFCLLFF